jgi:hypothetical protein
VETSIPSVETTTPTVKTHRNQLSDQHLVSASSLDHKMLCPLTADQLRADTTCVTGTNPVRRNPERRNAMTMTYVMTRRGNDGRWRLFYRGTGNEIFPGQTFATSAAARAFAAAH